MEKITAVDISRTEQMLLTDMTKTAAHASFSESRILPVSVRSDTDYSAGVSFSRVLNDAINNVDSLQHSAGQKQQDVDSGESGDLAGAMLESQKARIAFLSMLQVRNRLTGGLDDILNTPL